MNSDRHSKKNDIIYFIVNLFVFIGTCIFLAFVFNFVTKKKEIKVFVNAIDLTL